MRITIPNTSTHLKDLFTAQQKKDLLFFRNNKKLVLIFQNLGTQDFYCEKGNPATVADSSKIIASIGVMEVELDVDVNFDLNLYFISDSVNNTNVRVFPI